jgi:hypothetical protein
MGKVFALKVTFEKVDSESRTLQVTNKLPTWISNKHSLCTQKHDFWQKEQHSPPWSRKAFLQTTYLSQCYFTYTHKTLSVRVKRKMLMGTFRCTTTPPISSKFWSWFQWAPSNLVAPLCYTLLHKHCKEEKWVIVHHEWYLYPWKISMISYHANFNAW